MRTFESAQRFLTETDGEPTEHCCLVLDVSMPAMTGLQLQDELKARRCSIPIIMITGQAQSISWKSHSKSRPCWMPFTWPWIKAPGTVCSLASAKTGGAIIRADRAERDAVPWPMEGAHCK